MKLLDTLNRRFGRFAIPQLTLVFIVCQMMTYVLQFTRPELLERFVLIPNKVLAGEWWRLVSFLAHPPCENPLFALFFWYLFFIFGVALEANWGTFNYNLYLLVGYLATVGASFLNPEMPTVNHFLNISQFVAFAYLYPGFVLRLMFFMPVKIKWLAYLFWIGYGFMLLMGDWAVWLQMTASVVNFLIFFGPDLIFKARVGRWDMAQQVRKIAAKQIARHECSVCKATNITHPSLGFRYCTKCPTTTCFCEEHLKEHRHDEAVNAAAGGSGRD
jgi:hypothetical protein